MFQKLYVAEPWNGTIIFLITQVVIDCIIRCKQYVIGRAWQTKQLPSVKDVTNVNAINLERGNMESCQREA